MYFGVECTSDASHRLLHRIASRIAQVRKLARGRFQRLYAAAAGLTDGFPLGFLRHLPKYALVDKAAAAESRRDAERDGSAKPSSVCAVGRAPCT